MATAPAEPLTVGVLALQGAFSEHIQLLRKAAAALIALNSQHYTVSTFAFKEVRTPLELERCSALIVPGGESTTISLVAARSGLLEALREFVKSKRKPTWGTCAGLILLAESANRTKKGGQDLIGGLDVRVNRNHFGRQIESFTRNLRLPFLEELPRDLGTEEFKGVFIRAPIVERILPRVEGVQAAEEARADTVVAPSVQAQSGVDRRLVEDEVQVMATLKHRREHAGARPVVENGDTAVAHGEAEATADDIIAVRQGNCFGTSFHPELTDDPRIHIWWLMQVRRAYASPP